MCNTVNCLRYMYCSFEIGSHCIARLTWIWCVPCWVQTHRLLPAFAFQVLRLKAFTSTPYTSYNLDFLSLFYQFHENFTKCVLLIVALFHTSQILYSSTPPRSFTLSLFTKLGALFSPHTSICAVLTLPGAPLFEKTPTPSYSSCHRSSTRGRTLCRLPYPFWYSALA